jgi:hypothetical protein
VRFINGLLFRLQIDAAGIVPTTICFGLYYENTVSNSVLTVAGKTILRGFAKLHRRGFMPQKHLAYTVCVKINIFNLQQSFT